MHIRSMTLFYFSIKIIQNFIELNLNTKGKEAVCSLNAPKTLMMQHLNLQGLCQADIHVNIQLYLHFILTRAELGFCPPSLVV